VSALAWCVCCLALTALEFVQFSQTIAAYSFAGASALCAIIEPGRAIDAVLRGALFWIYVAMCLVSVLWSPVSQIALRGALEVALTIGAALIIARTLPPRSFLSALFCALLTATVASLLNPQRAWNAGALAMIGIFGSKNQFGLSQALLVLASAWVVVDARRPLAIRGVALLGATVGLLLLIEARSVDSTAVVIGALGCSYFAFKLSWFPRPWRPIILFAVVFTFSLLFTFVLIFASDLNIFAKGLQFVGKDATLTGRTLLWERATQLIKENPIFGMGYQGFWIQGNPYAEALWKHFQITGRTGFNFHNLWYEMGVQFGYAGLLLVFFIVSGTTISVLRWALRASSTESCFFLAFLIFVDIRTFVESELLGEFSLLTVLLTAASLYGRRPRQGYDVTDYRFALERAHRFSPKLF
jgi:exopolysaccharide production protein ExoQ